MKYKKALFALCGLILLIGFVIFLMMGGSDSQQDPPEANPTSQQDPSAEPSGDIVDSGLSKDDIPVPASSDQVTKWLLPSQVAGRVFTKVDLGVLATRLPKEKFAVFERMRLEFPEVDWTEIEQTHQAFLAKRSQLPLNLNDQQREAHAAWLAEVEPVSRALIALRAKDHGLSSGGMEGDRGYYIDGFRNGVPVYVVTANVGAANTTGASYVRWNPGNPAFDPALGATINGEGVYVNVNDHGEIHEHTEFQLPDAGGSRIMVKEVPWYAGDRNHMTHVTGTVAAWGYNSTLQGMAPRSWIRSLIQMNTSHITTYGMATLGQQMAETNPRTGNLQLRSVAGNTSLGTADPYNRYDTESASYDSVLRDYPYYMHFNSAGNDGAAGYESLTGAWKIAKNMITIGNVSAATRDANGIFTGGANIASNSSRGPTYDGRVTPDFVAKGTNVTSTLDTTGSGTWSGTSMASPNATGSVALLMDYVRQRLPQPYLRSSTYRALLMATADDRGNPGPDYTYGWGILNIHAAGKIVRRQAENPTLRVIVEDSLAPGQTWTETYGSDGLKPIQVAIAWLDPASSNTDPASRASRLVNDLDLVLIGPGGTEHKPYVMPFTTGQGATPAYDSSLYNANAVQGDNTTDAVEQVYIAAPAAGIYTVRVTHKGNLLGNQAQPFSAAVSGADELAVSMEVARGGSTIDTGGADGVSGTSAGTGTQLTYSISNVGGGQLELTTPVTISGQQKCSVTVNTQPSSTVAKGASTNLVATVTPNSAGTWSFNISIPNNDPAKAPYHWHVTGVAASSGTTPFTAAADTFIDNQNTGTNYGTETRMDLNNRTSGQNQSVRRGLIRFDLSSIPPGTTIESAKLDFVQDNAISGQINLVEATAAWWETSDVSPPNPGATWSNSNGFYGATSFGSATTGTSAGAAVPTITLNTPGLSKVQSWVNNSSTNHGFGITTTNNGNGQANWLALRSREHATIEHRPRLTLTYGGGTVQAPLMIVSGSDGVIPSGGTESISGSQQSVGIPLTYTIRNLGNTNLTMTTPVSTSSAANCTVTFNTQPSNLVAPSGSTELMLTVTPSGAGAWSATVSIPSNDADKNPYTWTISGTAPKFPATLTLNGLSQTYDGTPRIVTATTSPAGLAHSVTYDGGTSAPTNAGSYAVVATITDPNYEGSASGTLVISYTVSYQGNGSTSGTLPAEQTKFHDVDLTLATNSGNLSKADYSFAGWNTQADGSGTPYAAGATYSGNASLVLYAQWTPGADGTWIKTTAGPFAWSDWNNWSNGVIAAGADKTASFTPNITIAQVVTLDDVGRTIGNITFTDSGTSSHNLTISGANALTLDRTTGMPVIDVTQSGRTLTISSPISGADGLQKNGAGILTLNGTNDYTGGTLIDGGRVAIGTDARLGNATGGITLNGGELHISGAFTSTRGVTLNATAGNQILLQGNANWTNSGAFTGDGGITFRQNPSGNVSATLTSTSNDFKGALGIASGGSNITVKMRSLADSVTANGNIIFGAGTGGQAFEWDSAASSGLTLNNRKVEFAGNGNASGTIKNSNTTYAIIINTDIVIPGTGNKTLFLDMAGSANGPSNAITANLTNGTGGGTLSLNKTGGGLIALTGNNSYTGSTAIGSGTLSVNTLANFGQNSSIGAASSGAVTIGGTTGSATLRYTGGTTSTNRTIKISGWDQANTGGAIINNNGSGKLTFTASTFNENYNANNATTRPLTLGGSNDGEIQGVIQDGGSNLNPVDNLPFLKTSLTKSDAGTWTLSGNNRYTGSTTVSAGKLIINGDQSSATGNVTVSSGATLGGNGAVGGNVTINANGRLEFSISTAAASHNPLNLASAKALTFSGASVLSITSSGGASPGVYKLVTGGSITGSAPATLNLPQDWVASVSIVNNELVLDVTSVGIVGPGPVDHFLITGTPTQVTVGSPITGITLTAQDASNQTATSFTGVVTFGGTAGITGTSASFVDGVLSGVDITPAIVGNDLTFTVNDGAGHTGSVTFDVQSTYEDWANGTFANPFIETAPTANPDGDSMNNLMEFAFGTDPTLSREGPLAIDGSSHGSPTLIKNGGTMEFYFIRRKDHGTSGSVSYTPQFSNNLTSFTNNDNVTNPLIKVGDSALDAANYEVMKVLFPSGTKFGRVQVVAVPY